MAFDCLAGAERAYHPTKYHDSYANQKEAAELTIQAFLKDRLPKFLANLEACLKANTKSEKWVVGETVTFADAVLFQLIRGYKTS